MITQTAYGNLLAMADILKVLSTALTLLVIAATPLAVAASKKAGGGSSGGHASSGGGSKGGAAHTGMMHQSGMGHQGNAMQGNTGNLGKHSQSLGSQRRSFSTKSTHGQMALHGRTGTFASLHNHLNGSTLRAQAFHVQKFSTVFHNYHPVYHERVWWATHYNRVVLIGDGWYYWDAGYWYPAWGYDPAAVYVYDGPIYSYDNLPPDEVIMSVQSELEFQGYYHGPIDGQLGPETRAAIADFQKDHELEVTSAVDEPTVNLLGLA